MNSQASSGTRGVGPAESTGKSLVRYWPGGSRWLLSRLRPPKPLVKMPIGDPPFMANLVEPGTVPGVVARRKARDRLAERAVTADLRAMRWAFGAH